MPDRLVRLKYQAAQFIPGYYRLTEYYVSVTHTICVRWLLLLTGTDYSLGQYR